MRACNPHQRRYPGPLALRGTIRSVGAISPDVYRQCVAAFRVTEGHPLLQHVDGEASDRVHRAVAGLGFRQRRHGVGIFHLIGDELLGCIADASAVAYIL